MQPLPLRLLKSQRSGCSDGHSLADTALDGRGQPFNPSGVCDPEVYVGAVCETPSHGAALGLRFYNETAFPERYRGRAFIAEHGSWNRFPPSGFTLSTVDVGDATASGFISSVLDEEVQREADATYEEFLTGFRQYPKVECASTADCPGNSTCQLGAPDFDGLRYCGGRGRPVDVEVMRDGSILLSDDMNSLIYRIEYVGEAAAERATMPRDAEAGWSPSATLWGGLVGGSALLLAVFVRKCCTRRRRPSGEMGDALYTGFKSDGRG